MFLKLALVACSFGAVLSAYNGPLAGGVPAHQYPAGVSPQACPNFPNCNNPSVAATPNAPAPVHYAAQQYNPAAQYQPAYQAHQGSPVYQNAQNQHVSPNDPEFTGAYAPKDPLDAGDYTGDGDYRGEGLKEAEDQGHQAAPAYQQQAYQQQAYQQQAYQQPQAYQQQAYQQQAYQQPQAYQAQAYQQAPAHGPAAAVPAGVDPHSCPNYPYCH